MTKQMSLDLSGITNEEIEDTLYKTMTLPVGETMTDLGHSL